MFAFGAVEALQRLLTQSFETREELVPQQLKTGAALAYLRRMNR